MGLYACLFLASSATLLLEISLTRIFSVTQGYHFAFLAISLALLGFGASGAALALAPNLVSRHAKLIAAGSAALFAATSVGSVYLTNILPFDAYTLVWEPTQLVYLALYYLALAAPFFFAGLVVGAALTRYPSSSGTLYGANLVGAGVGCLLSVALPPVAGAVGAVGAAAALALAGAVLAAGREARRPALLAAIALAGVAAASAALPGLRELRLSPYKAVSQALRHEDAARAWSRWNAFSLLDVIDSGSLHAAPGLSFAYPGNLPSQMALAVDGDSLSPITDASPEQAEFTEYLPTALAHRLSGGGKALAIEPGGGLDVLTALRNGAESVTAVVSNPLVIEAVGERFADEAGRIFDRPGVTVVNAGPRSYLSRASERFDVIQITLSDSFRPVLAGAYGVSESYSYTVEAFRSYYSRLEPGGFLSATRWAQTPPSEGVRAVSVAVEGLERSGAEPANQLAVIRGLQTITLIVKRGPLDEADAAVIRDFADRLQYDLVYLPGIEAADLNRFSVHPEPVYHDVVTAILDPERRGALYSASVHDISPVHDDRPFYFHLFRWSQTPDVLASLGRTFQPFGGAGFLIALGSLVVAIVSASAFILAPLVLRPNRESADGERASLFNGGTGPGRLMPFVYFAGLGLGFLWVEIPLLQRFILYLDQPTYAFAAVLFAILVWSGVGSLASARLRLPIAAAASLAAVLSAACALGLPALFEATLGWPFAGRLALGVGLLAPLGIAMGAPFPRAIRLLGETAPEAVPWAWAVNGSTSVVSAILATLLALSFGFTWVILGGAAAYLAAAGAAWAWSGGAGRRAATGGLA